MTDDTTNLFDLSGKVAIVTGSTRGIGRAIALRLAQHGAAVVVSSRDAGASEATANDIRSGGGRALGIAAHIGKRDALQALVDGAIAEFGGVDVLVCNAAVNPYYGPLAGLPDEAFDRIMSSNVRSAVWLSNMVVPSMIARGGGSLIFLSSIVGFQGTATIGAYAISKAGLSQLARNYAVEHGHAGIRANAIAPGIVRTDFARALWENPAVAEPAIARSALGRLAEPDDIAGAAVFLAAPASGYCTGQTLVIDGGVTIVAGM